MTRQLPLLLLLCLAGCHWPGADRRSQGSLDSQKAWEQFNRTNKPAMTNTPATAAPRAKALSLMPPMALAIIITNKPPPKPILAIKLGWDHGKDEVPKNVTLNTANKLGGTDISYPCDFLLASDTPNGPNWSCIRTCLLAQTQSVIVSNTRPDQYFKVVGGFVKQ